MQNPNTESLLTRLLDLLRIHTLYGSRPYRVRNCGVAECLDRRRTACSRIVICPRVSKLERPLIGAIETLFRSRADSRPFEVLEFPLERLELFHDCRFLSMDVLTVHVLGEDRLIGCGALAGTKACS